MRVAPPLPNGAGSQGLTDGSDGDEELLGEVEVEI